MAGSGTQPPARQAEVGAAESGTEQEGCRLPDIGADLFGGVTISTAIRFIEMGPKTAYAEGDGRITP